MLLSHKRLPCFYVKGNGSSKLYLPQRKAPSQPHQLLPAKTKTNNTEETTTSQTRGLTSEPDQTTYSFVQNK